jgi:hypothetical protein
MDLQFNSKPEKLTGLFFHQFYVGLVDISMAVTSSFVVPFSVIKSFHLIPTIKTFTTCQSLHVFLLFASKSLVYTVNGCGAIEEKGIGTWYISSMQLFN